MSADLYINQSKDCLHWTSTLFGKQKEIYDTVPHFEPFIIKLGGGGEGKDLDIRKRTTEDSQ